MDVDALNTKTIGELNREFFDSTAESAYQVPWVCELVEQITSFLPEQIDWIGLPNGPGLRMLDYACGAGHISRAFAPFVSTIRGIDISNGMVEQYNAAALGHGIPRAQMHAVQGDLLENSESLNDPDFSGFHVIVMSMALHHVEDPAQMISKLAERLKSDGSLVIIDWATPAEGGLFGPPDFPAAHTVTRHGFKEEEIRKMFTAAGLSLGYLLHPRRSKVPPELGGEQQLFFARGRALVNTSTP